jgi:hypothetical protein
MRALARPHRLMARSRLGGLLVLAAAFLIAACASVGTDGGGGSRGTSESSPGRSPISAELSRTTTNESGGVT